MRHGNKHFQVMLSLNQFNHLANESSSHYTSDKIGKPNQ